MSVFWILSREYTRLTLVFSFVVLGGHNFAFTAIILGIHRGGTAMTTDVVYDATMLLVVRLWLNACMGCMSCPDR